jgi:GTP-binding protein
VQIISATYIKSSPGYKDCPPPAIPEYAFIGRSNVGKSSLINMLTGKKNLAKTSATPGKTQLINHFEIVSEISTGKHGQAKRYKWYLVDLPGYGYAKVSQSSRHNWENIISSYIRKRENLVNLFVLVDSRHEPQIPDLEFINQLGEWQIPFSLVFTKTDKNKPLATARHVREFLDEMKKTWEALPPHFLSSSVEKQGREELLDFISELTAN